MQAMTRKSLRAKETRRKVSAVQQPRDLVLHHKTAKCNGCGEIGHYKNCCKKAGNFPKKPQHTKKMHITGIAEQEFYDEEGNSHC